MVLRSISYCMAVMLSISGATASESFTVQPITVAEKIYAQGVVESINSATISAQVSGRIERVLVDVGDEVAAGAALLTITSVEQYQNLTQAQAQVAAAQANLVSAQQDFTRMQSLVARQLVPAAELDRAQAGLDNAKAQVKATTAAANRAQEQLSYTDVKAPYAGIVSARMVEPGELVQPGTPLLSGFDPSELRIHIDIPAQFASAAKGYQWARVNGFEPQGFQVFPTVDSQTSTVRVRLILPSDSGFIPGQWQPVSLQVGEHQGLLIPAAAVQRQGELTLVKMQDQSWRAVRLGGQLGDQIEIVSGLAAGEVIVYE